MCLGREISAMSHEREFHRKVEEIYHVAAHLGYRPTYFLQMVQQHGGVSAGKLLLSSPETQSGVIKLWQLERLDISMEDLVLQKRRNPPFHRELMTLARCRSACSSASIL